MLSIDKEVSKRLTKLYIAALTAVAVLSLVGQILIQRSLDDLSDDSHVVNIAGRQRMLSQRLCKIAILLSEEDHFSTDLKNYTPEFEQILELWKKCHEGLKSGNLILEKNYQVKNSPQINVMFRDISPYFHQIKENLVLISAKNSPPSEKKTLLTKILSAERMFLKKMDVIVFQYDLESKNRIDNLKNIELFLFWLTIGILTTEIFLIYRPLVGYVEGIIRKLSISEKQLLEKNLELEKTNIILLETQQNLVKTTQEKFELLRKEDNIKSSALLEGQEQERERIARELHDGIGQMLTGLKLHSEKLKSLPFETEKQRKDFEYHQNLINETIQATRNVSFNLMPVILSDFGLAATLKLLAEQAKQNSGIEVVFTENLQSTRLSYPLEINLYRITQEAITNALKYSKAKIITVDLRKNRENISLKIVDDGIGFDTKKKMNGNGLKNIFTRVRLLNGTAKIDSKRQKGTVIYIRI